MRMLTRTNRSAATAATAILLTAGGAAADVFQGLDHTAVGGVTLGQDPSGHLVISNIGSSGKDGVSINLGDATGFAMDMHVPASGTWQTGAMVCAFLGGPDNFIHVGADGVTGGQVELSIDLSGGLAPACVRVELLNNDVVIDNVSVQDSNAVVVATGGFGGDGVDPVTLVADPRALGPSIMLRLPAGVTMELAGSAGGPVIADAIRFVLVGIPPQGFELSECRLALADLPGNELVVEAEAIVSRLSPDDPVAITAEGDAAMLAVSGPDICAGCLECCDPAPADPFDRVGGVTVSNIGSSGLDGVRLACPRFSTWFFTELDMNTSPIAITLPGQELHVRATGTFGGLPGQSLGECAVRNSSGVVQVLADFTDLGSSEVTVEVRLDGVVQGVVLAAGGPGVVLGTLTPATPAPFGWNKCGKIGLDPPCFTMCSDELFLFDDGGGLAYAGNELRLLATGASGPVGVVASVSLLGSNLPPFTAAPRSTVSPGSLQLFGGMPHAAIGGVTLDVADVDGDGSNDLTINNLGSTGKDGVETRIPPAAKGARIYPNTVMDQLGSLEFGIYDDQCPTCPDGLVAGAGLEPVGPEETELNLHGCCGYTPSGHVILIKRNGTVAGSVVMAPDDPLTITVESGGGLRVTELAAEAHVVDPLPGEVRTGLRVAVEQDPPGAVGGPDVTVSHPVHGTFTEIAQVVWTGTEIGSSIGGIDRMRLTAAAAPACNPCSLVISAMAVVQHGLGFAGLGEARLAGDGDNDCDDEIDDDPLWISNIGSSGLDGVHINLAEHLCNGIDNDCNGVADERVTGVSLTAVQDPDYQDEHVLLRSLVTVNGAPAFTDLRWDLNPVPGQRTLSQTGFDWGGVTAGTIRVTARDQFNNPLAEVTGLSPGDVATVQLCFCEIKVEYIVNDPPGLAAGAPLLAAVEHRMAWPTPTEVTLSGGPTVLASSLEVSETPLSGAPVPLDVEVEALRLLMTAPIGVRGTLGVTGASVLTLGDPCPSDCGDDDGETGIVDFLALLAQWGGPGNCDFDGGGVRITDFLQLLANWGACP